MRSKGLAGNNNQVAPGYKQTEVGVIPEDWEVKYLASLLNSKPKNGYSEKSEKNARGTSTLRLSATSSGYLILNEITTKKIEKTIDINSELFLCPGDVLVQRSNTYDLVGTTAIFDGAPKTYIYPDIMIRLRFTEHSTAHLFWRYANSANGRRFFLSVAAGSTGSMPKISGAKLLGMKIPLPPVPEQKTIASVLSDVDALISALDKLIAKKRHIKTATMQQLLTGKTRLPGFGEGKGYKKSAIGLIPEDWEAILLDLVAKRGSGHTPDKKHPEYWNGNIKWVSLKDSDYLDCLYIYDTTDKTTLLGIANSSAVIHSAGSVILSRDAGVGKSAILKTEMAVSQHFMAWQCTSCLENHFLYYWFQFNKKEFERIAIGSTIKTIGLPYFRNIKIPYPPLPEQKAIASVLSDIDSEIAALEKRRAKTQAIKQGMMQELLTGRTRIIDN